LSALQGALIEQIVDGRYRIVDELGLGGMATVSRVVDLSTGAELALKQLSSEADARAHALFEREYHALASVRHPRIVEVHDYGTHLGRAYYTMELLQGHDLGKLAPMPWRDVCSCLRDVASGLSLLHARRMLYRDIKPRNLWRLADGHIKLIDFGALCPFGTPAEIVGTPPFVAPEALYSGSLDERTDLYALGALAYYLLSAVHPYPARELNELPAHWRVPFLPASLRVAELGRDDLPAVPEALDHLIGALLSHKPVQRPASAAELIDRLVAIAGLDPDADDVSIDAALRSAAFSGRVRERRTLRRRLRLCAAGRGSIVLVESKSGEGRSRMLRELAVEARVTGVAVVQVDAAACQGALGVGNACALSLLDALPELALKAARPYAAVLGHLSVELRARMQQPALAPLPPLPGERRTRIHGALRDFFQAVAATRRLLLLVDDLQFADESSVAWLIALAIEARQHGLMVVAAADADAIEAGESPARALRLCASTITLAPLSLADSSKMLRSMFGEATHLRRFAERLYDVTHGNPGHCLELLEHLAQRDVIANVGGTWVLPTQIIDDLLFSSRAEGLARRMERLPPQVLAFARVLAIRQQPWEIELCIELADGNAQQTHDAVAALLRIGLLTGSDQGYRFTHEATRRLLLAQLSAETQRTVHRRLGAALLSRENPAALQRLDAGVHLLKGGDEQRARDIVAEAARRLTLEEFDDLSSAVPALEQAAGLLSAAAPTSWERASVLAALSTAACFCDHRLLRYGDAAAAALQELVGLARARRLQRFLGRKLALLVALAGSAISLTLQARNPRLPSFRDAMMLLFNAVGSLAGAYAVFLDARNIARYSAVLEPFSVLGRDQLAALIHELTEGLRLTAEDRAADASAHWDRLLARLESDRPIRDLPDYLKPRVLGGALFAAGVVQAYRDGPGALRTAERLEQLEIKLYAMGAEEIRSVWYAHQAEVALSARHRDRAEMFATALGASWQVQAWAPSVLIGVSIRTRDALAAKHAAEQLQRSSQNMPSLALYAQMARGTHLALRHRYDAAAAELEACLGAEPLSFSGWVATASVLASAYRGLGQHERARELCVRTLAALKPGDLAFPVQMSRLQAELARAQSALGQHAEAAASLDDLIAMHAPARGPLTLGMLHEARAQVALAAADAEAYRFHLERMQAWYRPTGIPALIEQCEQLAQAGRPVLASVPPADAYAEEDTVIEGRRQQS